MDPLERMALVHHLENLLKNQGISTPVAQVELTGAVKWLSEGERVTMTVTSDEPGPSAIGTADEIGGDELFSYPPLLWDIAEEHSLHPRELSKSFLEGLTAKSHEELKRLAASQGKSVATKEQVISQAEELWQFLEEAFGPKAA